MTSPAVPSTLAEALALTDEARIVTSASKPYAIMHTNAAWSKATGYKFTEASGKTCAILQGPETESAVLSLLSYMLKAPMVPPGTPVVNSLFKQRSCIENILRACVGLPPDSCMALEHKQGPSVADPNPAKKQKVTANGA